MSGLSTYAGNIILNRIFKQVDLPALGNLYLALCHSSTGLYPNTRIDEVTGGGYVRVNLSATNMATSLAARTMNLEEIVFPIATTNWGTVSHLAIMDSSTPGTGNVIAYGEFKDPNTGDPLPREANVGDNFVLRAGALVVRFVPLV